MSDLISVIIPIYNRQDYLEKCFESILNQTYENLEIILVDDGSSDGSLQICEKYANCDSRIKIVHKKNGGLSSARNAGLEIATGEWISFIDSDDSINLNFYSLLKEVADKENSDIVQCEMESVPSQKLTSSIYQYQLITFSGEQALEEFYGRKYTVFKSSCNKIFRKYLFENVQYPEGHIFEDRWVANELYYQSKRVTYIDIPLYYYTVNENGIMHQNASKKNYDTCLLYLNHYEYFINKGEEKMAALAIRQFFISLLNLRYVLKRFSNIYNEERNVLLRLYRENIDKLWKSTQLSINYKVLISFAWKNIWIYYTLRDMIDYYLTKKNKFRGGKK